MRTLQCYRVAILSLLYLLGSCAPTCAANEYVGSQFANGTIFSEVVVQDHLFAIPFPNVHGPLATGHTESWLVRWNVADLKTNQPNRSSQVIYLARQPRTGEMAYGFRASASSDFLACDAASAVELYSLNAKKPARLLKSLPAADPATTPPPARLFSRSEEYVFLWKPTPAIYAVSNLSVVKQIKVTESFKQFEAGLRKEGGWQESLTDDLKYLIHVPLQFGGPFNQNTMIDTPHCYNLETDEYTNWKLHAGTNQTIIVEAESVGGRPQFMAFWEAAGARHLGILDRDSHVLGELPIQGTTETQFWRNTDWDYSNFRFFVRQPGGKLTIYDYRTNQTLDFSLTHAELKVR
jgi:hypothetical protein